jgi:hypothetical protein
VEAGLCPISANLSGLGLKACQLPTSPFLDSFPLADSTPGIVLAVDNSPDRIAVWHYCRDERSSRMRRFLVSSVAANCRSISYPMLPKGIPSTNRICGLLIAN